MRSATSPASPSGVSSRPFVVRRNRTAPSVSSSARICWPTAAGAPLGGYCWFPFVDSVDWNSLLARADGCIDPVGVGSGQPET